MKQGSHKGSTEHRYSGKRSIAVNRNDAQLLLQEAIIRREFGEEGVRRFWEEVNSRAETEADDDLR